MFGSGAKTGFGGFGTGSSAPTSTTPVWGQVATINNDQNAATPANEWYGDGRGTSAFDFKPTFFKEAVGSYLNVYLQSIMMQPEYKKFSHEELRMQDYMAGRIFGENPEAGKPQPNTGSKLHAFVETRDKDTLANTPVFYQSIIFMTQYKGNSNEELRMEDYRQGLVFQGDNQKSSYGTMSTGFGSSAFGSASRTTGFGTPSTSAFGAASSAPSGFGSTSAAPSGFGMSSATPSRFGAPSATSSGFGASSFGTASTSFGASSFGSTSGFGAKPTTGFGASGAPTTGFGSQATSGFGSSTFGATSSAFGGIGSTSTATPFGNSAAQAKPAFGSFGAATPQTGFGAATSFNTGSSGFGTNSTGFGNTAATGFGAQPSAFGNNQASGSIFGAKPSTGIGSMTSQPTNTMGGFGQTTSSFSGFSNPQTSLLASAAPAGPPKPSAADLNPWGNILLFDDLKKNNPEILTLKSETTKPPPAASNPITSSEEELIDIDIDEFFKSSLNKTNYLKPSVRQSHHFEAPQLSFSGNSSFPITDSSPFLAPPLRYNVPLRHANMLNRTYNVPPVATTITPVEPSEKDT